MRTFRCSCSTIYRSNSTVLSQLCLLNVFVFQLSVSTVQLIMDSLTPLIKSLGNLNSRETEAAELIEWIQERWEEIKREVTDVVRPKDAKRRTFGKREGELVDKLVNICNYKCDSGNREKVNSIMVTLGYEGYDKKSRFRQRMENCLKKRRKNDKSFHPSSRKPGGKERKRSTKEKYSEEDQDGDMDNYKNSLLTRDMSSITLGVDTPPSILDDLDRYIMVDYVNTMKRNELLSVDPSYDEIVRMISLYRDDKEENYDSIPAQEEVNPSIDDGVSSQHNLSDAATGMSFQVCDLHLQNPSDVGLPSDSYPSITAMNGWHAAH